MQVDGGDSLCQFAAIGTQMLGQPGAPLGPHQVSGLINAAATGAGAAPDKPGMSPMVQRQQTDDQRIFTVPPGG